LLSDLPADGGTVRLSLVASLSDLEVAQGDLLTTKARVGKVWGGWSWPQLALIEAERLGTNLRLTMAKCLAINANFVDDLFMPSIVGSFFGLIRAVVGGDTRHDSEGSSTIRVSLMGGFSGVVRVGGGRWVLNGMLDGEVRMRFGEGYEREVLLLRVPLSGYVLTLRVDLDPAGEWWISGELRRLTREGSEVLSSVGANRHRLDGRTTTVATRYSWVVPAQPQINGMEVTSYSQGDGVGAIWVSRRGDVRLVEVLADGVRLNGEMPIQRTLRVPLFRPLHQASAGGFKGEMELKIGGASGDIWGEELFWFRPVMNRAPYAFGWLEGMVLEGGADGQQ
jgi:hypothetical protein